MQGAHQTVPCRGPYSGERSGRASATGMSKVREIIINELRPTQITVGMIEVAEKRRELVEMMRYHPHRLRQYLADHAIPTVAGYDRRYFLVDHHHLGRALWEAGVENGPFEEIGDL